MDFLNTNPQYASVRYLDGWEDMISLRDLAPAGNESGRTKLRILRVLSLVFRIFILFYRPLIFLAYYLIFSVQICIFFFILLCSFNSANHAFFSVFTVYIFAGQFLFLQILVLVYFIFSAYISIFFSSFVSAIFSFFFFRVLLFFGLFLLVCILINLLVQYLIYLFNGYILFFAYRSFFRETFFFSHHTSFMFPLTFFISVF